MVSKCFTPMGHCEIYQFDAQNVFFKNWFAFLLCLGDSLSLLVCHQNQEGKKLVIFGLFIHSCPALSFILSVTFLFFFVLATFLITPGRQSDEYSFFIPVAWFVCFFQSCFSLHFCTQFCSHFPLVETKENSVC